jgi:hypothetical protein
MVFYRLGFENDISADGIERRSFGKPIAALYGFSTSLEPPHLIVESLVS